MSKRVTYGVYYNNCRKCDTIFEIQKHKNKKFDKKKII